MARYQLDKNTLLEVIEPEQTTNGAIYRRGQWSINTTDAAIVARLGKPAGEIDLAEFWPSISGRGTVVYTKMDVQAGRDAIGSASIIGVGPVEYLRHQS